MPTVLLTKLNPMYKAARLRNVTPMYLKKERKKLNYVFVSSCIREKTLHTIKITGYHSSVVVVDPLVNSNNHLR